MTTLFYAGEKYQHRLYYYIIFFPPLPHRLLDVGALLIYHAIESVMEN